MASGLTLPDVAGGVLNAARLNPTFASVGFELRYSGDADNDATCTVRVKKASEPDQPWAYPDGGWRAGLPGWRITTADGEGYKSFYGSLLLLDAGTSYHLEWTITDPDVGSDVVTATVSTRGENLTTHAQLVAAATRFVKPDGSNAADGLTPETAWQTVQYAWDNAPAGSVVLLEPGVYERPGFYTSILSQNGRTSISFVARHPACDERGNPINAALRSLIVPPAAHHTAAGTNAWTQVQLAGPGNNGNPVGALYTVWTHNFGVANIARLLLAETATGETTEVCPWKVDASHLATAAGWAEKLYTNLTYRYGFWANQTTGEVYLRLPGDADPNQYHLTAVGAVQVAMMFQGADSRCSGIAFRGWSHAVAERRASCARTLVDRNFADGVGCLCYSHANGNLSSDRPTDTVVQGNRVRNGGLRGAWTTGNPGPWVIPWKVVKASIRNADGTTYATTKVAGAVEMFPVYGRGGANRLVVRHNQFVGGFNGVSPSYSASFDRYAGSNVDVYENRFERVADDAMEPEGQSINVRWWGNEVREALTSRSLGPVTYGPVYFFRNHATRLGRNGNGVTDDGQVADGVMVKYSGASSPQAKVYLLHETLSTDAPDMSGGDEYASAGANEEALELRNTLIRATRYPFLAPSGAGKWTESHCLLATSDPTRSMTVGVTQYATPATYRAGTSQGAGTNVVNGADQPFSKAGWLDVLLKAGGHLTRGPLVAVGAPVPNVSDVAYPGAGPREAWMYDGAGPLVGADHAALVPPATRLQRLRARLR